MYRDDELRMRLIEETTPHIRGLLDHYDRLSSTPMTIMRANSASAWEMWKPIQERIEEQREEIAAIQRDILLLAVNLRGIPELRKEEPKS